MSDTDRRPTLTDCGCEASVYPDGSGIELHFCPLHQAASELLEALRLMLEHRDIDARIVARAAIAKATMQATPMTHTALPWFVDADNPTVIGAGTGPTRRVAIASPEDARFIVRACNSQKDLVDRMGRVIAAIGPARKATGDFIVHLSGKRNADKYWELRTAAEEANGKLTEALTAFTAIAQPTEE